MFAALRSDRLALFYPVCTVVFLLACFVLIRAAAQGTGLPAPTAEDRVLTAIKQHDETDEKRWLAISTQIETLRRQIHPKGTR